LMRAIWKYQLDIVNEQSFAMPAGALLLRIERVGAFGCLWALVDPAAPPVKRTFRTYSTGQSVKDDCYHVGTYVLEPFVWHVFEDISAPVTVIDAEIVKQ
jgi:hypothetical protein